MSGSLSYPESPRELRALLRERGLSPSKRFGQHFLIEPRLLDVIARLGELGEKDLVLEVGTGPGNLTRRLADFAGLVVTVEIDEGLYNLSRDLLGSRSNIRLVHGDVLEAKTKLNSEVVEKLDVGLVAPDLDSFKVVANLPYNISTPFLTSLILRFGPPDRMVLLVQKELADSLVAKPGSKEYGPLRIIFALLMDVTRDRTLSSEVFWPRPQVDSAIVVTSSKGLDPVPVIRAYGLMRYLFSARRKTIGGLLKRLPVEMGGPLDADAVAEVLKAAELSGRERAESLSPEIFLILDRAVSSLADQG
ncbi:MAG: 16S rRNA (adenine(1518)-N(6)/adenine(1519)-N(6))-dimethyltransferase RsmA [Planctomycetota bacterium]